MSIKVPSTAIASASHAKSLQRIESFCADLAEKKSAHLPASTAIATRLVARQLLLALKGAGIAEVDDQLELAGRYFECGPEMSRAPFAQRWQQLIVEPGLTDEVKLAEFFALLEVAERSAKQRLDTEA